MATITLGSASSSSTTIANHQWKAMPTVLEAVIEFAAAATSKGSALAAADVIEALRVPANSYILHVGVEVLVAVTGASSDTTIDVGTGADVDQWVDGYDLDAVVAGAFATPVAIATTEPRRYLASADTVDVLFATATTAPTAGKVRVFALIVNFTQPEFVGLAQIGD